jgi:hypothetical protein
MTTTANHDATRLLGRRQVLIVLGGVMLAMLLGALNQMVVATALPMIVGDAQRYRAQVRGSPLRLLGRLVLPEGHAYRSGSVGGRSGGEYACRRLEGVGHVPTGKR